MSQVNPLLLELFRAHGVESVADGEWIAFPGRNLKAGAAIVREIQHSSALLSVQLDVRLELAPGRAIIESFAGLGQTTDQASAEAFGNFAANSFHVLLAAFFQSEDKQVSREEWAIGGRRCQVTVGNVGIRGKPPVQGEQLVGWFKQFEGKLKQKQVGPGTHWVRLYYAQMQGRATACEVLLDNAVWEEMQTEMAAIDWPSGEDFYSVRVFLVVQAEYGDLNTPENAVARLADTLAAQAEFSEDDVYAAMAKAGIPTAVADRAYKFTQTAWGRALLDRLGVRFSPDYLCLNGAGDVVESGRLEEEPYFVAARRLAVDYAPTPGFRRLALMSADVNAVNSLLRSGSKPENCTTGPAALFLEAATPAGIEKAQQAIARHMKSLRKPAAQESTSAKKPWWQFWG